MKLSEKLMKRLLILDGLFVTALVLGNILGSKVTSIFGITVSVGIFAYPLTFLITDIVAEVLGKKVSRWFLFSGMAALVFALVLTLIGIGMPPASFYEHNDAYRTVFSNSVRIIIASFIAFGFSQTHDIWAFHIVKKSTQGKFLWLRNNLSTIVSQLIDTVLFTFIAFYMVTPEFTVARIISMIIPYWFLKVCVALLDTPLVYLGVKWLKSENGKDFSNSKD